MQYQLAYSCMYSTTTRVQYYSSTRLGGSMHNIHISNTTVQCSMHRSMKSIHTYYYAYYAQYELVVCILPRIHTIQLLYPYSSCSSSSELENASCFPVLLSFLITADGQGSRCGGKNGRQLGTLGELITVHMPENMGRLHSLLQYYLLLLY